MRMVQWMSISDRRFQPGRKTTGRRPSPVRAGTLSCERAIAHAATKRELVAKKRPAGWMPPNMFLFPKV